MISFSPLPPETEETARRVIGCAIEVHRRLGPGYLESIYARALQLELDTQGLKFEAEKSIFVEYRGFQIPGQRVDLVVEERLIVELKTVRRLKMVHRGQVLSYLKTTKLRLGLLINFQTPVLRNGIRRVIL
jgi:GxxExxY protein